MSAQVVFADANVLYSRTTRDWLFLLRRASAGGMFTVITSEDVIAETTYHLRKKFPLADGDMIATLHHQIANSCDDIVRKFPGGKKSPSADIHDSHVHAAATHAKADYLLTSDSGFTRLSDEVRDSLSYEVYTPDELFCLIADSAPQVVRNVAVEQIAYWASKSEQDGRQRSLVERLGAAGCPQFAVYVQTQIKQLAGIPAS